ncbi:MAG: hypothetical protein PHQ96_01775 [Candidatus Omnitrophica bacterium]|nr:hypothetical protein [Candidatus Omnitrophota bacterium]
MLIKKQFSILLLVVSFLLPVCSGGPCAYSKEKLVYADDYNINIFYAVKRQALTKDYEIFIASNGEVTVFNKDYYSGPRFSPKTIVKSGTLSLSKLKELKELILSINIFRFNDEYISSTNPLGYRGDELRITINGKTKKILLSASSFPVEIGQLLRVIDDIKTEINNS